MSAYGERIARMEGEVQGLKKAFDEHKQETRERMDRIEGKLDDLLTLRNKGAGVFWLASVLIGTGLVGTVLAIINYFKGA